MQVLQTKLENGVKLVSIEGRLDMQGFGAIETKFTALVSSEKAAVVVDLSKVDFIASIGIRLFVINAKSLAARGGKLALLNPQPMVEEVLTTVGIGQMIRIFSDAEEAFAYVLADA